MPGSALGLQQDLARPVAGLHLFRLFHQVLEAGSVSRAGPARTCHGPALAAAGSWLGILEDSEKLAAQERGDAEKACMSASAQLVP